MGNSKEICTVFGQKLNGNSQEICTEFMQKFCTDLLYRENSQEISIVVGHKLKGNFEGNLYINWKEIKREVRRRFPKKCASYS